MERMDLDDILKVALEAARTAGSYLKESYGRHSGLEYKGEINLVTENDKRSQDIIYKIINSAFPHHSILGEEDLDEKQHGEARWVIDPIDGTTNFAHGLPIFSISIAFMTAEKSLAGVVYVPMLDEMFTSILGGGSYLNGRPIRVSDEEDLGKSLLATGFPYDRRVSVDNNVEHFNRFITRVLCIRRLGSAAIDLCYTAAGRFDGYWELKLFPWDSAAGALILEEAGGRVTDFSGAPYIPGMKECLASNGRIHQQMMDILNRR